MQPKSAHFRLFLFVLAAAVFTFGCQLFSPSGDKPDVSLQTTITPGVQENPLIPTVEAANELATVQPTIAPVIHLQLTGQLGGVAYAAAVQGNTAYMGAGPRLLALDMSNPAAPLQIGQSAVLPGVVRDVLPQNDLVYVAAGKAGVRVLDLSSPETMPEVGQLSTKGWAMELAQVGDLLIIATNTNDVLIADISDPAHPSQLGSAPFNRAATCIGVFGSTLYLGDASGGLTILDITNPSAPALIATNQVSESVYDLAIQNSTLFLAAGQAGLLVFDLGSPNAPRQISATPTAYADGILVNDSTVFLSDYAMGIYRFDVSNPANPSQTGHNEKTLVGQQVPGGRRMALFEQTLLIPDLNTGLRLLNVGNTGLEEMGQFATQLPGMAFDVQVTGGTAYIIEDLLGLFTADVSNAAAPYQLGADTSKVKGGLRTPRGLAVRDNLVYIADVNLGLRVEDVSDPAHPVEVAAVETPKGMTDIVLQGNYAYVTVQDHKQGENRGLRVFDISNPTAPVQVGALILPRSPQTLALYGSYAVVPDMLEINETGQPAALHLVDISNPASPNQVGALDTSSLAPSAMSILVNGSVAYLGDLRTGLHVIDLFDPSQPELVGSLPELYGVYDLAISGSKLFGACYDRVVVVDITDPLQPRLEETYITSGLAWGIEATGDRIYVADLDGGLVLLQYTP